MRPLLRTEAVVRAALLDVRSYAVALDVTRGDRLFRSTTTIRFGCAEPGAATFVEIQPETLLRAELNGRPLDLAEHADNRLELADLAADNELLVEADMAYSRTAEGLHRFTDPADGAVYVYSACAPDLASKLFACFDQPDLKAPFTFTVTAPDGWTVVGNGRSSRLDDGRWEIAPVGPISCYLVAVAAGPLYAVRAEHDGIPLGLYARRSLAAELDREAPDLFAVTRASFDRLHGLFEERYPFGGYDQVFMPELNWAAMENPACVLFQDEMLFRSAPTDTQRALRAVVVCHEMSHMWFGNLVTLAWWEDVWLNESFAEVLGYRIAAESTRYDSAWTLFSRRKSWGYDADERPTTHPVAATGAASAAEALSAFDGISYAKGASALHQLVHWMGDEAFFAGLNRYFAAHRWGNANLQDFLAALALPAGPAGAQGPDLSGWADDWLRTTGVDTLRIEVEVEIEAGAGTGTGAGAEVEVEAGADTVPGAAPGVLTSAVLVNDGTRPHRVRVGVYDRDGAAVVPRRRLDVEVAPGGRTPLPELSGAPRPALLLPNDGDFTWARLRLDAHSAATVAASLSAVTDELARAVLWEHLRDLTRGAEASAADYLDLVAAHLPGETSDCVVEAVLAFAADHVIGRYLAPADRPAALARLGDTARTVLARPAATTGEGLRLAALRTAVATASGATQLARLQGWLAGDGVPDGLAFDADLRWSALARLAAAGAADEERIAAELAADPGNVSEVGAARARAALPDDAAKERAWHLLFAPGELTNHQLVATAEGFWRSGAPRIQQAYVRRYFEQLPAAGERGGAVVQALSRALFPVGAADADTVRAAEECLARTDLVPPMRRHLADGLDDLRRALAHRV
ncbi:aminopeptidase N [Streptomyces sp. CBMA29]|uniref:aminopeptidase N n=1 Tax=Streptomyces sp. CBMA29 TaxID=1896314 RepID=UPI0016618E16|nr:aminopeptidase N [Streptomyces sp. CBMA29]MBD0738287.1 aminopeptidase N [Streptomyces sp. CBMA29]